LPLSKRRGRTPQVGGTKKKREDRTLVGWGVRRSKDYDLGVGLEGAV